MSVFELISKFLQAFRNDPSAAQKQLVTHLAKQNLNPKCRQRQYRRSMDRLTEGLCKLLVRDRIRCHGVYRPANILVFKEKVDYSDLVVYRYPAHPLFPASDHAANAQFEWRKHRTERAAF